MRCWDSSGPSLAKPRSSTNSRLPRKQFPSTMFFRTAAPMTVKGPPRKGESSLPSMRNDLRTQPAPLVREQLPTDHEHAVQTREYQSDQSSRLLLGCRHRRCCPHEALQAHQQERVRACAAHRRSWSVPERCSPSRSSLRRAERALPTVRAVLARRPCDGRLRQEHFRAASPTKRKAALPPCGGKQAWLFNQSNRQHLEGIDRSLHIQKGPSLPTGNRMQRVVFRSAITV